MVRAALTRGAARGLARRLELLNGLDLQLSMVALKASGPGAQAQQRAFRDERRELPSLATSGLSTSRFQASLCCTSSVACKA